MSVYYPYVTFEDTKGEISRSSWANEWQYNVLKTKKKKNNLVKNPVVNREWEKEGGGMTVDPLPDFITMGDIPLIMIVNTQR